MRWAIAMVFLISTTTIVGAGPDPWAVGVTEQQKTRARTLLDAGNALLLDRKYLEALATYREAIASWDHPAIRFNIVRCLIQLDRVAEAAENLKLALKYGAAPLEDAVYNEALAYQKLLAKQIGDLSIACEQRGAVLTIDGQPLATCPARVSRRVVIGRHQIVGTLDGFVPKTVEIVIGGGETQQIEVELAPLVGIQRRWKPWKPWLVFAGGLTVVGIGALLDVHAFSRSKDYDRELGTNCPDGCAPDDPTVVRIADKQSSAKLENTIGNVVIAAGIATAVTGSVLLYMNRGRTTDPAENRRVVGVAPIRGGAALTLRGDF